MVWAFLPAALILSLLLLGPVQSRASQSVRYRQQTGDQVQLFRQTLEPGPPWRLSADRAEARHLTIMDQELATQRWKLTQTGKGTEVSAQREGNTLRLTGQFQGKPADQVLQLDDVPWFQALSVSLRTLLTSKSGEQEFWMLRPDTLEHHKLRGVRQGLETLELGGQAVPAWRIEVRLTGFKSLFWKSHYWLRQSDGQFLRYRGPSGPPGAPMTEVELVGENG
ncbi:MAG: hypothetical protein ACYDAI_18590 [Trichloromonadaceae bacterium]